MNGPELEKLKKELRKEIRQELLYEMKEQHKRKSLEGNFIYIRYFLIGLFYPFTLFFNFFIYLGIGSQKAVNWLNRILSKFYGWILSKRKKK